MSVSTTSEGETRRSARLLGVEAPDIPFDFSRKKKTKIPVSPMIYASDTSEDESESSTTSSPPRTEVQWTPSPPGSSVTIVPKYRPKEQELRDAELELALKEMQEKQLLLDLEKVRVEREFLERRASILRKSDSMTTNVTTLRDMNTNVITNNIPPPLSRQQPATIPPPRSTLNSEDDAVSVLSKALSEQTLAITMAMSKITSSLDPTTNGQKQLVSRQFMGHELPKFSGDPQEWPLFISKYERTTKMCGLTDEENLERLQKSLTGKALDSVRSFLCLPENVSEVMSVLEFNFGRTDQIIESLIEKAKLTTPPKEGRPETLISFANVVRNTVKTIEVMGYTVHLNNPHLLKKLTSKLPISLQMTWNMHAIDSNKDVNLVNFAEWLKKVSMAASLTHPCKEKKDLTNVDVPTRNNRDVLLTTVAVPSSSHRYKQPTVLRCKLCSKDHHMDQCPQFTAMTPTDRLAKVKELRVCYRCLKGGHVAAVCNSRVKCDISECGLPHHTMLHLKPAAEPETKYCGHTREKNGTAVLLRILPVRVQGPAGAVDTYALLDNASTTTMIDESLATKLQLQGPVEPLSLQWTGELQQHFENSQNVSLKISGVREDSTVHMMTDVHTVPNLALPTQSLDVTALRQSFPHLVNIPFDSMKLARPMMLIGEQHAVLTTGRKMVSAADDAPVATKTMLGWTIHGNVPMRGRIDSQFVFHACSPNDVLHEMVKSSFTTESFGVKIIDANSRSRQDKRAMDILEATTKSLGERYETGLLWKDPNVTLPNSRPTAMNRLICMERKMDRDPMFKAAYEDKIQEFVSKGYARLMSQAEASVVGPKTWYLPHFGVFNANKPGKLRFVFDAAAKSHGVSLNDNLMTGPDLLRPPPTILFHFRQGRVAFTGDIKEMFPQVRIIKDDQDSQRFLWRGSDRHRTPDVYVMQSMTFGSACSPTSAIYTKDLHAKRYENVFPAAVDSILHRHYMDDLLDSVSSEDEAMSLIRDVSLIYAEGGFTICNWSSNSKAVMHSISPDMRAKSFLDLDFDTRLPVERVLGMFWDAEEDVFQFKLKFHKVKPAVLDGSLRPTKRDVLKLVMSIFDPLGLLTHFMIKARILLQVIWKSSIGWDDEIQDEHLTKWRIWVTELQRITDIRIPRWYAPNSANSNVKVQLHMFCDSSA